MAIFSTTTTISVGSFPYAVPAKGQASTIGVNTEADVRPSTHSDFEWRYSLFASYGGGCYVPEYSMGGAYVIAGTGGHNVNPNFGAAVFDFTDAKWKRIDNTNGVAWREADLAPGDLVSEGFVAGGNDTPAPSHLYMNHVPMPAALGSGSKGSVILTFRYAANTQGGSQSSRAVRFDLGTGKWSKLSTNSFDANEAMYFDTATMYDPVTKRFYLPSLEAHFVSFIRYLDANDWTWKSVSVSTSFIGQTRNPFIDVARRLLIAPTSLGALRLLDLNAPNLGWRSVSFSGSLPSHNEQWHFYPPDGCWYSYKGSGQTINKLTPPSSNYFSSTWAFSNVTLGGATLGTDMAITEHDNHHYTRFFYVPSLQCFAWIAGGSSRVALIKPA